MNLNSHGQSLAPSELLTHLPQLLGIPVPPGKLCWSLEPTIRVVLPALSSDGVLQAAVERGLCPVPRRLDEAAKDLVAYEVEQKGGGVLALLGVSGNMYANGRLCRWSFAHIDIIFYFYGLICTVRMIIIYVTFGAVYPLNLNLYFAFTI